MKFAKSYKPLRGDMVMMTGLMSVAHDFAPERDFVSSSLAAPDFYYQTSGLSKPATRMNLSFQVEQQLNDNASISLDIQGSFSGSDYAGGALGLGLKSSF